MNSSKCGTGRSAKNLVILIALSFLSACGGGGGGAGTADSGTTNVNTPPTGSMLYQANCQGCHQPLPVSTKLDKSAAAIQGAITADTGGMGALSKLTPSEVQLIADALKTIVAFPAFDSANIAALQLNGSATVNAGSIRLTPNERYSAGSAFLTSPFTLGNNFVFNAYFNFTMGAGGASSRHADGLVFTLQTMSSKAGADGGNQGFGKIQPSFGVEFDTYRNYENYDPNDNHVTLVKNGVLVHDAYTPVIPPVVLTDGKPHHVWVDYDGTNVEVRINSVADRNTAFLLISSPVDLKSIFASQYVYFGFTAATGNESQTHDIGGFYLTSAYRTAGISPAP